MRCKHTKARMLTTRNGWGTVTIPDASGAERDVADWCPECGALGLWSGNRRMWQRPTDKQGEG